MGFLARAIGRRVRNHGLLAIATVLTGGLALPLHFLAEKFHVVGDIHDALGGDVPDVPSDAADAVGGSQPSFTGSKSGDYLGAGNHIDSNTQYTLPSGQTVYGSDLKEGASQGVYGSGTDQYVHTSNADAIRKSDIKVGKA